ncbi:arginine repressor [Ligilactobacillus ruminis DPC 6832]|nr:arginine repressor [Ligilactobacillus ruminis DPC 6832]
MQIVKQQDGDGHLRYVVFKEQNQAEWLRLYKAIYDFVIEITQVEFVNVVKTMPRNANVLAAIIDDLKPECVAGTIAGYDTLVVISPSADAALEFKKMAIEHINHDAIGIAPEDD